MISFEKITASIDRTDYALPALAALETSIANGSTILPAAFTRRRHDHGAHRHASCGARLDRQHTAGARNTIRHRLVLAVPETRVAGSARLDQGPHRCGDDRIGRA